MRESLSFVNYADNVPSDTSEQSTPTEIDTIVDNKDAIDKNLLIENNLIGSAWYCHDVTQNRDVLIRIHGYETTTAVLYKLGLTSLPDDESEDLSQEVYGRRDYEAPKDFDQIATNLALRMMDTLNANMLVFDGGGITGYQMESTRDCGLPKVGNTTQRFNIEAIW